MSISHNIRCWSALLVLIAVSPFASAEAQNAAPGFETFTVPNPNARVNAAPRKIKAIISLPTRRFSSAKNHLRTELDLRLFPGDNDLGVNLTGRWNGQTITSQTSPMRWLHNDWMNSGYFQATGGQQGARLGSSTSDLLGNVNGMRLFTSPTKNGGATFGLGLYQSLGTTRPSFTLAADSQWQTGRGQQVGFLMAADSSWRLTQQSQSKRFQMSSFLGRDARSRGMESGLLLEAYPTRFLSLYSRVSAWGGSLPGREWAAGITQWLGGGILALNHSRQSLSSGLLQQTSASYFLPLRRDSMTLRWEGDTSTNPSSSGANSQQSHSLFATYASPLRPNLSLWADGGVYWQDAEPRQSSLTVGGTYALDSHWELQSAVTQRLDNGSRQIRTALGYRLNPDQELKLLFGPSAQVGSDGQTKQAFGLELVQRFDVTKSSDGSISGQVLLDGKPCSQRLVFRLESGEETATDTQGRFRFPHVASGPCSLQLSLAELPANLSTDNFSCKVDVKPQKTSSVSFSVHRVGQVQGIVRVAPDAFGQTDCTAGIGITIAASDTLATTTNGENAFLLGGLPLGTSRLTLVAGTIPPDFQIVGPDHFDIEIVPGQPIPSVVFHIAPRIRPVDFSATASRGSN